MVTDVCHCGTKKGINALKEPPLAHKKSVTVETVTLIFICRGI